MTTAAPLDGLKAIASHLEQAASAKGLHMLVSTALAWKWIKRKADPLPTHRRRTGAGRLADPIAVEAWLWRQRFCVCSDGK